MEASSWLEIDLNRLAMNLAGLRGLLTPQQPGAAATMICAVVKANAYGLGARPIAQTLARHGVDMLAVYAPEQARTLADLPISQPILVLAPLRQIKREDPLTQTARAERLHLTLHDAAQLAEIERIGAMVDRPIPVHLHLDTGMSRSGIAETDLLGVLDEVARCKHVRLAGIYTHFATSDSDADFAGEQHRRFDQAVNACEGAAEGSVIRHVANTAAAIRHHGFHRDMVRAGLGLYGYGASLFDDSTLIDKAADMRPIMRWRSRINHVRPYPAGATVGYGRTHQLTRTSVLGVVPVGYADGYPLLLGNQGFVTLPESGFAAAPLLGKVNMDQIVIDLTDVPQDARSVGQLVELISDNPQSPCSLDKLAKAAQSHCYEMLTRIGTHVERRYASDSDPVPGRREKRETP